MPPVDVVNRHHVTLMSVYESEMSLLLVPKYVNVVPQNIRLFSLPQCLSSKYRNLIETGTLLMRSLLFIAPRSSHQALGVYSSPASI